jgi:hypothetical protein
VVSVTVTAVAVGDVEDGADGEALDDSSPHPTAAQARARAKHRTNTAVLTVLARGIVSSTR